MPSPPPSSRNRSRSRSPDRRQPSGSSSAASKPRAPPKQLDIYKRSAGGRSADPLDSMPPRGSTGSSYRRSAPTDEGDYRSRADRRAGREEGGGGRAGCSSGRDDDRRGGYSDDRRGGYGGDDRDRRGGDRYRDDDRRRGDDRDSRGGSGYGRPQDRDGPPPPSSSSSSSARPPVGLTSAPSSTTPSSAAAPPAAAPPPRAMGGTLIEIIANDRLGRKVRVKCSPQDTVGDLKKLIAAQSGTDHRKIQLKKSNHIFKNHITLYDYEINDGMSLELY